MSTGGSLDPVDHRPCVKAIEWLKNARRGKYLRDGKQLPFNQSFNQSHVTLEDYLLFLGLWLTPFAVLYLILALAIPRSRVVMFWISAVVYTAFMLLAWDGACFHYEINMKTADTPDPSLVFPAFLIFGWAVFGGELLLATLLRPTKKRRG